MDGCALTAAGLLVAVAWQALEIGRLRGKVRDLRHRVFAISVRLDEQRRAADQQRRRADAERTGYRAQLDGMRTRVDELRELAAGLALLGPLEELRAQMSTFDRLREQWADTEATTDAQAPSA